MTLRVYQHQTIELFLLVFSDKVTLQDGYDILALDQHDERVSTASPKIIILEPQADFSDIGFLDILDYASDVHELNAFLRSEGYVFPKEIPILETSENQNLFLKLWLAVADILPHQLPRNPLYKDSCALATALGLPADIAEDIRRRTGFIELCPMATESKMRA